jgi:hypothetical protein
MASKKKQDDTPDFGAPREQVIPHLAENPNLSRQAQFSDYEEVEPEPANPPNGRQVEQTLNEAESGQPIPSFREFSGQQ